jgi:uncharacterized protein YndB with AHSA1/START domain
MPTNLIARSSVSIEVPRARVWDALTNPDIIREYMFGTQVASDWRPGATITWTGEWQGKRYEDKGVIRRIERERVLEYTHYSPLSGLPDRPENHHTVTVELASAGDLTHVTLTQDNNPDEQAREHSEKNWDTMLAGLKKHLEHPETGNG